MGAHFLIDTNTAIDLFKGNLSAASTEWLISVFTERAYSLSIIVRIELLSYGEASSQELAGVHALMSKAAHILPLDEPVVLETIRLRKLYKRKLPDAIIAATALVHGLTIVTRNVADFRSIPGLAVLDPHDTSSLPTL